MSCIAIDTKCRVLHQALTELKSNGSLNNLKDVEKIISSFGVNIFEKNTLEFDFELQGKLYEERLYEYIIPSSNGDFTTFYVDKELGFKCGEYLPKQYKKIVSKLHLYSTNSTIH